MRVPTLVGIVLLLVGGVIVFRGVNYGSQRSVLKLGDFEASVEEHRAVPVWVGGVAIVVGLGLVVAGMGRRRDA
jgi:hypothetical protein